MEIKKIYVFFFFFLLLSFENCDIAILQKCDISISIVARGLTLYLLIDDAKYIIW